MKKVLMIAYHFPPVAGVGIFRVLKFVKYLPRFGWKPVVLTVRNPDLSMTRVDPDFVQDRLDYVKVFRAFGVPLGWIAKAGRLGINYRWFVIPDTFAGWIPFAVLAGKKVIQREKVNVIYATCPPAANLLIGAILKKKTRKPLVVDYRDLWAANPFYKPPTKFHMKITKKIEESVLKNSDAVVVVEQSSKEKLLETYPFLKSEDVRVIPNGFDPEDFMGAKPYSFDMFVILHAGTIYGPRVKHFQTFLKALQMVVHDIKPKDLKVVLIGKHPPSVERMLPKLIKELDLSHVVYNLGSKPYKETLPLILGADILLLIPGASNMRTAKIYDYLAAKRFILNICYKSSESAEIIRETKAGITVPPDVNAIYRALVDILETKKTEVFVKDEMLMKYSRIEITKQISTILNKVSL